MVINYELLLYIIVPPSCFIFYDCLYFSNHLEQKREDNLINDILRCHNPLCKKFSLRQIINLYLNVVLTSFINPSKIPVARNELRI